MPGNSEACLLHGDACGTYRKVAVLDIVAGVHCVAEIAKHTELAEHFKLDISFADPHILWQGGSKEVTKGLFCECLPKGWADRCIQDLLQR